MRPKSHRRIRAAYQRLRKARTKSARIEARRALRRAQEQLAQRGMRNGN